MEVDGGARGDCVLKQKQNTNREGVIVNTRQPALQHGSYAVGI